MGTGKSFFAGCIANALLDRDVPVLMTNFPTILNRLTGMFSEDRADLSPALASTTCSSLTIWVVERSTEYAMEQMFFVIDSRYRSRRPMIITTNLKLAELKRTRLTWPTPASMTVSWNGAPRSSLPGRTSGRKTPGHQAGGKRHCKP